MTTTTAASRSRPTRRCRSSGSPATSPPPPRSCIRAHTDPELFARWVGPRRHADPDRRWDAAHRRQLALRASRDGEEFGFRGCFHEVRPDRIVQTFTFEACPTASRWRRCGSRTSATAAPGCTRSRWWTASRAATPGCAAAWSPGSTRATPSSTELLADGAPLTAGRASTDSWPRRSPTGSTAPATGTRRRRSQGWPARDVVRHLIEWLPAVLAGGAGIELPPGSAVDEDPAAAWHAHGDAVQALLDEPDTADRRSPTRISAELPLDQAIDRFYTTDVFMHTWDLARATGQDDRLDPRAVRRAAGRDGADRRDAPRHPASTAPACRSAGRRSAGPADRVHRARPVLGRRLAGLIHPDRLTTRAVPRRQSSPWPGRRSRPAAAGPARTATATAGRLRTVTR